MADEMTREEFTEALGGLETRLNGRTDRLEQIMTERFGNVDQQFTRVDGHFKRVDEQFKRVDEQFKRVDEQFKRVDEQFKHVDEQLKHVGDQFQRADEQFRGIHARIERLQDDMDEQFGLVKIQFEKIRGDLKFGLEGRESLREAMERRFEEARGRDETQHDLLKQVLHHVRGRVENLERGRNSP